MIFIALLFLEDEAADISLDVKIVEIKFSLKFRSHLQKVLYSDSLMMSINSVGWLMCLSLAFGVFCGDSLGENELV
ncbi:hypothetical protein AXF42_Ash009185 [Apostasia shenzhenica]|uniref:Uncharacterized protein n=1 Tax=Apostasia shenzhenica TaxID=1088818 RepID=A0A2I0ADR8_9ASPA|nr:hypothetical protein AXF42_Ash009185 [Apostasia shenzhenica]